MGYRGGCDWPDACGVDVPRLLELQTATPALTQIPVPPTCRS